MSRSSPEIRMCFLLKVDNDFWSEAEISAKLPLLEEVARQGRIDLSTTDGAVSIVYRGEELLGSEFWDEINIPISFMVADLPKLLEGEPIEQYFPVQAYWITLIPRQNHVLYKLELQRQHRIEHIVRLLPLHDFAQELELVFWRMMRILASLGARSPMQTVANWRETVKTRGAVNKLDMLQWILEQPLTVVLNEQARCEHED